MRINSVKDIYQLGQEVCDVAHLLLFDVQTLNDVVRRRPERAILIDDCVSYVLSNRLGGMSLTIDRSKDRNKAI